MSTRHVEAARYFSRRAAVIEKAPQGTSQFGVEHRAYAMGSIMSSVAFLEAAINELFIDAADGHLSCVGELVPDKVKVLKDGWAGIENQLGTINKYQRAHRLLEVTGSPALENLFRLTRLLVDLRHELTHHKPVTRVAGDRYELSSRIRSLENDLPKLFVRNAFVTTETPFVPDGCLGAGGATWAVKTAERFATEFFGSIGLQPNFMRVSFQTTDQDS